MEKQASATDTVHGQAPALIRKFTSAKYLKPIISQALQEDLGTGDLTEGLFASSPKTENAKLVAKADGILSGSYLVDAVYRHLHPRIKVKWNFKDGEPIKKGQVLATIAGPIAALLQGERVALNFLQRMSGIATLTGQFVALIGKGKSKPRIYDTRKTTPLLRAFEKKAVVDGGGSSHRFALYDMAMLKDNHIDAAGGISEAVQSLGESGFFDRRPRLGLCIEVRSLDEALEAIGCRADIIMLDNMSPATIRTTADKLKRRARSLGIRMPELEISGGITVKNIKKYSELPVQRISVGALTHSAPALDISMLFARP